MSGSEVCGDNRFELVAKYRAKLIDGTNIEDRPEEMAVIDNVLFRFWQMGWLDRLETSDNENEQLRERVKAAHLSRLLTENENEKLRKLANVLWYCSRDRLDDEPPCCLCELKSQKVCEQMAKELGVIE